MFINKLIAKIELFASSLYPGGNLNPPKVR